MKFLFPLRKQRDELFDHLVEESEADPDILEECARGNYDNFKCEYLDLDFGTDYYDCDEVEFRDYLKICQQIQALEQAEYNRQMGFPVTEEVAA